MGRWNLYNKDDPDNLIGVADFVFKVGPYIFALADTVSHNYEKRGELDKKIQGGKIYKNV